MMHRAWVAGALLLVLGVGCRHAEGDGERTPTLQPPTSDAEQPTVAVFPFTPHGEAPEQTALAKAMAIEIIDWLQQVPDLTLLDPGTVLTFEDTDRDTEAYARALGADVLVLGRTTLEGDEVAVEARMVPLGSDEVLWSVERRVPLSRAYALQAELALEIAQVLDAEFLPAAARRAHRATETTLPLEAYRAYLAALSAEEMSEPQRRLLNRVVTLAPDFARGWAVLADYLVYPLCHDLVPRDELYAPARTAVRRALTLDPDDPQAHAAAAHLTWECDWNWEAGERHLRRALDLSPGFTWARHLYAGGLLPAASRKEDAVEVARPLVAQSPAWYAYDYIFRLVEAGREEQAMEVFETLKRRNQDWDVDYVTRGLLLRQGRYDQVLERMPTDADLADAPPDLLGALGLLYARTGREAEAREALAQLRRRDAPPPMEVARILIGLGDETAALDALEAALARHSGRLVHLGHQDEWDPLRDEPRFEAIVRAVGIPE